MQRSFSVEANNRLIIVLQIVKTPGLETRHFNHSIKPRPLMDPVFSWVMQVGALFNIL